MEIWGWTMIIIGGFIGLYILVRVLSSAIFRSYFELKKLFNKKEDTNGQKRS
jgi:hypothetical protein